MKSKSQSTKKHNSSGGGDPRGQVALFPKALRSFLRGADDDPIFREDATKLVGPYTAEALMVPPHHSLG